MQAFGQKMLAVIWYVYFILYSTVWKSIQKSLKIPKGVIRSRIDSKDRLYNEQKKKRRKKTNNGGQNTTHKTKGWVTGAGEIKKTHSIW